MNAQYTGWEDEKMREVTYFIDDNQYFRSQYASEISPEKLDEILENMPSFRCIYSLKSQEGDETQPAYYRLTTFDLEPISINTLNGYQKGCIIADCGRHFEGRVEKPQGVVRIEEFKRKENGKWLLEISWIN